MNRFVEMLRRYRNKRIWRKANPHNTTQLIGDGDPGLITAGRYTYGGIHALTFNTRNRLEIGDFCSIAPGVVFVVSADHSTDTVSTFPFPEKVLGDSSAGAASKGDILIADDVWIGYGATILSGVHIGQGAVIAAGAVVTCDIAPYEIAGGIPAKHIKYRFEPEWRARLMRIDYSALSEQQIREHLPELQRPLRNMQDVTHLLSWMPVKAEMP